MGGVLLMLLLGIKYYQIKIICLTEIGYLFGVVV